MQGYAKVFSQIFEGSMRGQPDLILVFVNILCHTSSEGICDRHWNCIIDETGLSKERVLTALTVLESPDMESHRPALEGRRIIRIDEHRTWGWQIVNHAHYRDLYSKSVNATRQTRYRERNAIITPPRYAHEGEDVVVDVSIKGESEGKNETHPELTLLRSQPNLRGITLEQFLRLRADYKGYGDFMALCQQVCDDAAMMTVIDHPGAYAKKRMSFHTTPPDKPEKKWADGKELQY